jgi:predicted Na+-dependent transporter
MTSLHRLIAIALVWALLTLIAIVSNGSFGVFRQPGWLILTVNILYLAVALAATYFIARAKAPGA